MSNRPEIKGDIGNGLAETTTSFPIKTGGIAYNFDGTIPQAGVFEACRVQSMYTPDGRQLVELGHPYFFSTIATYAAAQTNAAVVAAPAAGLSLYITDIVIASGVNAAVGRLSLLDDLTTTGEKIRFRLKTDGNESYSLRQPIKLTAAKALGITTDATTCSIFISGYTAP